MRAFITNSQLTNFMQVCDIFRSVQVVYQDLDLGYAYTNEKGEEIIIGEENLVLSFAKEEFGPNLILLFGKDKPLYIHPHIQTISTGKRWTRLIDVLWKYYPNLKFEYDQHFTNIKIKGSCLAEVVK